MEQQIKLNNKNNKKQNESIPIKLAFQANIFKYVQRKKKQISIFSAIKEKNNHLTQQNPSILSNLINKNTSFNFYSSTQNSNLQHKNLFSTRIKLLNGKNIKKQDQHQKKIKGHKSSLSDWRILYDQRNDIVQKHQLKNSAPDKMAVTDRLFYPSKKQSNHHNQTSCPKIKNCGKQHNYNQNKQPNYKQQKHFVSDQNFIHMYHRSVSPIVSDLIEKRRIVKYLKQNKDKRQSRHGLRLMNEAIFSQTTGSDVGFVPYKYQKVQSKSKLFQNLQQCVNTQIVTLQKHRQNNSNSILKKKNKQNFRITQNKNHFSKFQNNSNQQTQKSIQDNKNNQNDQQNPQNIYLQPTKQTGYKNKIKLTEFFSKTIDGNFYMKKQNSQLKLKYFKPRQNKIQKAILNVRNNLSQNKFDNFQYNPQSPKYRKKSFNKITHKNWIK